MLPEGAREYPPAAVFEAEDLFVFDGLTLELVSRKTGIPISTVKRWSSEKGWSSKRQDFREKESLIRQKQVDARLKLITDCATQGNPMAAFGFQALENAAAKAREVALKEKALEAPKELRPITTQEEAVAALEEALTIKLNRMLADPGAMDLKAVKDVREAMMLIQEMRTREDNHGNKPKGLSADLEATFRELLG